MNWATYSPGDGWAVVVGQQAILLGGTPPLPLVTALHEAMAGGGGLGDVLEILVDSGLRSIDSFAAAELDGDETRVVVRGGFSAAVDAETITGSGLWTDRRLAGRRAVDLVGLAESELWLPLSGGAVRAAAIRLRDAETAPGPVVAAETPVRPDRTPPVFPELPSSEESEPAAISVTDASEPATIGSPTGEPAAREDLASPTPEVGGGLVIDSLPWANAPAADVASPLAPLAPRVADSVAESARAAEPAVDSEAMELTIDRSRLVAAPAAPVVTVVAARCEAGHLSPGHASKCRVCGNLIPAQEPFEVARPTLGVLRLSNGDTVPLDRGAILGRNPHLSEDHDGEQPNLVRLADPGKDVSSQHLDVSLDYWHVLVTDLGSTNGTTVELPGRPPQQLRAHDPLAIEPGTRVILADVIEFVFEVTG